MTAAFKIRNGVSKPKPIRVLPKREPKYPFEKLEVGDSFLIPHKKRNTLTAYASEQGRAMKRKFSTRLLWMKQIDGEWEECAEGTPGAVQGIGVWRDK